jgi:hypothetical protein
MGRFSMDRSFFEQANPHCVDSLLRTTKNKAIVASEDIFDVRGIKLLARSKPITVSLQERLLACRLKKPLELCLRVEDGVTAKDVVRHARRLIDSTPALAKLIGGNEAKIIELLGNIKISGAPHLLLTAAAEDGSGIFAHSVLTTLITTAIALNLRLPDSAVENAAVAALLHDLGEIYISPDYLRSTRDLAPDEWKQVATHPRLTAILLSELAGYPSPIVAATQEHHERLDGTGYPYGKSGDAISGLGQILLTAETLSSIVPSPENPETRSKLALGLVPSQYPHNAAAVVFDAYQDSIPVIPMSFDLPTLMTAARDITRRLSDARAQALSIGERRDITPPQADLARRAREVCRNLTMSLNASGILEILEAGEADFRQDPSLATELQVVVRELTWRLRALSRHIALTASFLKPPLDAFDEIARTLRVPDSRSSTANAQVFLGDLKDATIRTSRFLHQEDLPQGKVMFDLGAVKFVLEPDGKKLWYLRKSRDNGYYAFSTIVDDARLKEFMNLASSAGPIAAVGTLDVLARPANTVPAIDEEST